MRRTIVYIVQANCPYRNMDIGRRMYSSSFPCAGQRPVENRQSNDTEQTFTGDGFRCVLGARLRWVGMIELRGDQRARERYEQKKKNARAQRTLRIPSGTDG